MEGLLLVDKPSGPTSHDVVGGIRRLLDGVRVGHAGTLDPAASGLLVILVGPATRKAALFSGMDKTYEGTVRLGTRTDTADAEGKPVETKEVPLLSAAEISATLAGFIGEIRQKPPAYSAVKVKGRPAYWYARKGQSVDLPERTVRIARLKLLDWRPQESSFDFRADCSSGTYVRTLAEAFSESLRTVGHLTRLRRTRVGSYGVDGSLAWGPGLTREDLLGRLLTVPELDISMETPGIVDDTE